jgi:hypothetical protein
VYTKSRNNLRLVYDSVGNKYAGPHWNRRINTFDFQIAFLMNSARLFALRNVISGSAYAITSSFQAAKPPQISSTQNSRHYAIKINLPAIHATTAQSVLVLAAAVGAATLRIAATATKRR